MNFVHVIISSLYNLAITIHTENNISAVLQQWDALLPENHHLRSRHLLAFEKAAVDGIVNNYVLVFKDSSLTGVVYLQQFIIRKQDIQLNGNASPQNFIYRLLMPEKVPLLICGHLLRINFEGYYFASEADQEYLFKAIDLWCRERDYNPAGIVIKDCPDDFIEKKCHLSGYSFFDGDVTMELSSRKEWRNFDDYISSLSKKYRQRAKKILAKLPELDERQLSLDEMQQQCKRIDELYQNVLSKQAVKLGVVNPSYFCELKKDFGNKFEFHALYYRDVMVGFYTFLFYEDHMETHFIGLDYAVNQTHSLYFNILFKSIGRMIEKGYPLLELGRTGREAKANAGAVPRQVFNYVKVRNPLVRFAVRVYLNRFNKSVGDSYAARSVFR